MNRIRTFLAASSALLAICPAALAQAPADLSPWLQSLTPRNIGPTTMGGRISDIAVYEKEPRIFFVASASGGLFRTDNAGLTFDPVFDREGSISLGAAAVSQKDPNVVWVGTGEASSRNSVAWGDGVYKSKDGGKTWKNMGLKETMHISKVLIDPRNDDVVYVAALGRLWGSNPERGVYKTTNGGETWQLILKVDDKTGCIDLIMNPKSPDNLIAAMWQRERKAYDFTSGGPGSGIYRTENGGKVWSKVDRGVPRSNLGRVGLSFHRNDPKMVVASIEYKPSAEEMKGRTAESGAIRMNGGGIYLSDDSGKSFKFVNATNPRPFYFSMPRYDVQNPDLIYLPGVELSKSEDRGKTFKQQNTNVHPDWHVLWINPADPKHLISGTDGGAFESRDQGKTWRHLNGMAIGQFYAIGVDMRRPYWVYGGLQDNSNWGIPTQTSYGNIQYFHGVPLGGGDGFYNLVDPTDWRTVYSESQGGAAYRTDLVTGANRSIRPRGQGIRFNWNTPFAISAHNAKTLYFGGNKLFKSVNRGDNWEEISPDLTTNNPAKLSPGKNSVTPENTGAEQHCTIVTIGESPLKAGTIYVGTDDGLVQLTQDDGKTWTNLTPNIPGLPAEVWCSRVTASKWVAGRAYATFDGHRSNDFNPYVYVTEDFGKTWKKLNNGLPGNDSAYVIREGEKNPELLYLGTEMSLYVSLNRGENWTRFRSGNFPTVAVHDLLVHPVELDLVIATHGRSIWTVDVSGLEQLTTKEMEKDVAVFRPQDVLLLGRVGGTQWAGESGFAVNNSQPGTRIFYWLKSAPKGNVTITITDPAGVETTELRGVTNNAGLNVVTWNGRLNRLPVAGDYRIVLKVGDKEYTSSVKVVEAYLNK